MNSEAPSRFPYSCFSLGNLLQKPSHYHSILQPLHSLKGYKAESQPASVFSNYRWSNNYGIHSCDGSQKCWAITEDCISCCDTGNIIRAITSGGLRNHIVSQPGKPLFHSRCTQRKSGKVRDDYHRQELQPREIFLPSLTGACTQTSLLYEESQHFRKYSILSIDNKVETEVKWQTYSWSRL